MRRSRMSRTLLVPALLLLAGCGGGSREAGFAAALPPAPPPPPSQADPAQGGAIFSHAAGYAPLHYGTRARQVGDPVTVALVERITTSKSTSGKTGRDGSIGITPPSVGPFSFNPGVLNSGGTASFKGQGDAAQASSLFGEISVVIAEVRPNATALIRGEKLMTLSQGEEWVQFSGIVRLADISPDNRIVSSRVADARIAYAGKGAVHTASRPGWLNRFFNMVSPF